MALKARGHNPRNAKYKYKIKGRKIVDATVTVGCAVCAERAVATYLAGLVRLVRLPRRRGHTIV
jgi:hypothetical protein